MFKDGLLRGRRVLITGGGTGLGKGMAESFLELGADIIICGRRKSVCEATAAAAAEALAGLLAVTRASLRAALFDLTAEGLVERIPNRGARVRAVTLDEAVAITECRMALEGLCAAKAAELVTEAQAARLRDLGEEMERRVADGEPLKYSALNHELHRLIREISAQTVAADMLERLNGQLVRHQFQLSLRPGRPQASLPEHLAMISAITGRRPAEAEEATRSHLRSVITALRETEEAS